MYRKIKNKACLYLQAAVTLFRRNNVRVWYDVAHSGPPSWDKRNSILGGFIKPNSSVLDIGCGAQTLKGYLPAGCYYQPCDLIKGSPEVIVCDLNAGVYPAVDRQFDYVVCSGVLEYMRDADEFLRRVPQLGRTTLISYNPFYPGDSKVARLGNGWGWVNHFSEEELQQMFDRHNLKWTLLHRNELRYVIYSVVRRSEVESFAS
jgi:hypothetical protein